MKKIYEIREYSQELRVDKYDIKDVYAGMTFMGDFSNKDYEVVKIFDSLDDAIKEFEKYESDFVLGTGFRNPHIFTEYTIDEVLYDDEGEWIDDEYVKISELHFEEIQILNRPY